MQRRHLVYDSKFKTNLKLDYDPLPPLRHHGVLRCVSIYGCRYRRIIVDLSTMKEIRMSFHSSR